MVQFRRHAREWSLVFSGAVGAYLLSIIVTARLSLLLSDAVLGLASTWARVALGMLALDLGKIPGVLLASWLLALISRLSPLAIALGLVLTAYGFDLGVTLLLKQASWLWGHPMVLLCRILAAALQVWLAVLTVRWKRKR